MRERKKPKKTKKSTNLMLLLAVLVLFLAAAVYSWMEEGSLPVFGRRNTAEEAVFEPTDVSIKYENVRNVSFFATENGDFFHCTGDHVRFLSPTGQVKWETSIDVLSPFVVGNGSFIAVGEVNGKAIFVLGRSGLVYAKYFEGRNILNFSVNRQGFASVILQNGENYETAVFDEKGNSIWEWKYQLPGIYPVTTAISHDNRILANSTLEVNEHLVSEVVFAFLNRNEAAAYTDTIFKSVIKESSVIPEIEFLDNKAVAILSDKDISGMTFTDGADTKNEWSHELNNRISTFAVYGRGIAVAFDDGIVNKESEKPGTVNFYNAAGVVTGTFYEGENVTYMSAMGNNVVIGIGRTYYGVTDKGKILWRYDSTTDLKDVFILNNDDTILTVSQSEAVVLKRSR